MTHDEEEKFIAAKKRLISKFMGGGKCGVHSIGTKMQDDEPCIAVSASSWKIKQIPSEWEGYRIIVREAGPGHVLTYQPKWPDDFRGFGSNVQPAKKEDKLHGGQTVDF